MKRRLMPNDEIRMTKHEGNPDNEGKKTPAVRNSSFLIVRLVVALTFALATNGCFEKHIRKANVDQVTEGMSKKQVESILGPPTSIDSADWVIMKKTTYIYRQGKDTVTLVFKDDKLQSKESTLHD